MKRPENCDSVRENLLGMAQEASRKGWWESCSDVYSAALMEFIGLEAEARSVAVWHLDVVMRRKRMLDQVPSLNLQVVVATEGLKEQFYIEDSQNTYLHQLVFDTLLDVSLDAEASRELIIRTAEKEWRRS